MDNDQHANITSYIENLRKPCGVPPFMQREVATLLEGLQGRLGEMNAKLCDLIYAGNRLVDAGSLAERVELGIAWHQAVEKAIPDHAKPTVCKREEPQ